MKGAAQRGFLAVLSGLAVFVLAGECSAQPPAEASKPVEVTDADRVFRNFTRESAVVNQNQIRVEVRALRTEEMSEGGDPDCKGPNRSNCARLNTIGQRILGVEDVYGSIIDVVASYGLFHNAEVGAILPFVIETVKRDDGSMDTEEDIGDVLFYGKYKQPVAEHCTVSGGLELTAPTGDETQTRTMPARFRVNGSNAGRGY